VRRITPPATAARCQNSFMNLLSSLEREWLPARESLFDPVPVLDALFPEVPAEEHCFETLRVVCRKVDQPLVEILHLHTGRFELTHEERDLGADLRSLLLELAHPLRVETTAVPGHSSFDLLEPGSNMHEAPPSAYEPLDQRPYDLERVVGFLLGEDPHRAMLNSALA
jgi:hypothetical protein